MSNIFLQIFVGICFIGLILILFFEKFDYILYSVLFLVIASIVSAVFIEEAREIMFYIGSIEWEVILFFIGIFVIVEVLRESNFFEELARRITKRFLKSPRKLFYVLTIIATFLASIISGLSIVVIFVPLTIIICKKMEINPAPYLFSLSVCVNLAATLTPFGSAQNILISNEFGLSLLWFLTFIVPYFIVTFILSLFLLDKFILRKEINKSSRVEELKDKMINNEYTVKSEEIEKLDFHKDTEGVRKTKDHKTDDIFEDKDFLLDQMEMSKKDFYKNCGALILLIVLLIVLPEIYFASLISCLVFVFINPRQTEESKFSLIHYLQNIDYKLIYFFICLFIFIGLMELNGTLLLLEKGIENLSGQDEFLLAVIILIFASFFSGLLDNTPITIIFIPIIQILLELPEFYSGPLLIALILGVNLGGNFLPQGSPADLTILEIGKKNKIKELTYKRMVVIGGLFAILHILVGLLYLYLVIFIPPLLI